MVGDTPSNMTTGKFSLLLAGPEFLRPVEIAQVLAALRQIPYQDAVMAAKKSWGFLAQSVDIKSAEDMAARFKTAGLETVIIPQNALQSLPPASSITRLSLSDQEITGRVVLIAAGGFDQKAVKTIEVKEGPSTAQKMMGLGIMMATGLPVGFGKKKTSEKIVESSELVFFADLILKDPPERLRIDAQHFDYSCLGSRMVYHALGNFRLLLEALATAAPGARWGRGTKVIIENRPIREMGYESLEDLERESRWLTALASCGNK